MELQSCTSFEDPNGVDKCVVLLGLRAVSLPEVTILGTCIVPQNRDFLWGYQIPSFREKACAQSLTGGANPQQSSPSLASTQHRPTCRPTPTDCPGASLWAGLVLHVSPRWGVACQMYACARRHCRDPLWKQRLHCRCRC